MAIFASFLRPVFSASHVQHISDLHSKFAKGHTMCGSMADIQSPTVEIRRGNKKERRKKKQHENIYGLPYYIGRPPCENQNKAQNPLKFVGVPQTRQQISAVSRPKFTILSGHVEEVLLLNTFFSDCRYMP